MNTECVFCGTVPADTLKEHYQSDQHKQNESKTLLQRPEGNFCDGCPLLLTLDYEALCKINFSFVIQHIDDSYLPDREYNLFRYYNEDTGEIGPPVDDSDEDDYDGWDIKAVKPESCKKFHPALYLHKVEVPEIIKLREGLQGVPLSTLEKYAKPLLNSMTHVFMKGKHDGQPIWDVALVDPLYLVWLVEEETTDDVSLDYIQDYIYDNPDQFKDLI